MVKAFDIEFLFVILLSGMYSLCFQTEASWEMVTFAFYSFYFLFIHFIYSSYFILFIYSFILFIIYFILFFYLFILFIHFIYLFYFIYLFILFIHFILFYYSFYLLCYCLIYYSIATLSHARQYFWPLRMGCFFYVLLLLFPFFFSKNSIRWVIFYDNLHFFLLSGLGVFFVTLYAYLSSSRLFPFRGYIFRI